MLVNGKIWLRGLPPFVTINGERCYCDDGSLMFKERKYTSGTDNLGKWNKITDVYEHKASSAVIGFAFKTYNGFTGVIFYQVREIMSIFINCKHKYGTTARIL